MCVLSLTPVDIHSPDITGRRLLSDRNIELNSPVRKKRDMVNFEVGETSDVSSLTDDKMDVIAYCFPP